MNDSVHGGLSLLGVCHHTFSHLNYIFFLWSTLQDCCKKWAAVCVHVKAMDMDQVVLWSHLKRHCPRLAYKSCDFQSCCIMMKNSTNLRRRICQILNNWCLSVKSALNTTHEDVSFLSASVSEVCLTSQQLFEQTVSAGFPSYTKFVEIIEKNIPYWP